MCKELFRIGDITIHDDEIDKLSSLQKNWVPKCGRALLDYRDDIVSMAKDMPKVSEPTQKIITREIELLINGIIHALVNEEIELRKGEKQ